MSVPAFVRSSTGFAQSSPTLSERSRRSQCTRVLRRHGGRRRRAVISADGLRGRAASRDVAGDHLSVSPAIPAHAGITETETLTSCPWMQLVRTGSFCPSSFLAEMTRSTFPADSRRSPHKRRRFPGRSSSSITGQPTALFRSLVHSGIDCRSGSHLLRNGQTSPTPRMSEPRLLELKRWYSSTLTTRWHPAFWRRCIQR